MQVKRFFKFDHILQGFISQNMHGRGLVDGDCLPASDEVHRIMHILLK